MYFYVALRIKYTEQSTGYGLERHIKNAKRYMNWRESPEFFVVTMMSFVSLCINDCHDFVFSLVDLFVFYVMQPTELEYDDNQWWQEKPAAKHPKVGHILNIVLLLTYAVVIIAPWYLPVRLVLLELLSITCMY